MVKKPRAIVVFFLGLLLFNWPILSISGQASPLLAFLYLFIAWALIIVLAFLLPNHSKYRSPEPDRKPMQG